MMRKLCDQQGGRMLDDSADNFTMELTGAANLVDDFIDRLVGRAEILAVVRSGPLAISRGQQVLSSAIG